MPESNIKGSPSIDLSEGLMISAGFVNDMSGVNKFGENPTLATSSTETIWDGSNTYTFPSTADITHIRQATDQAAMRGATVEVQGLRLSGSSWFLSVQDVVLDAANTTTPVALTTPLIRVFRMKVKANVVTTQDVELRNVGGGTTYAIITAGNNQTLMAIYTVPTNYTAYVSAYYASLNKDSGGGDPDVIIKMWNQDNENTYAPQLKHVLGLDTDATSYFKHGFSPYLKLEERTDVYLTATNLSGSATADVSGGFDLVLMVN